MSKTHIFDSFGIQAEYDEDQLRPMCEQRLAADGHRRNGAYLADGLAQILRKRAVGHST